MSPQQKADLDWSVYHLLVTRTCNELSGIAQHLGVERGAVAESLARLEHSLLVTRIGETFRPLSFGESILACRIRYDRDIGLEIENGVVRVQRSREE